MTSRASTILLIEDSPTQALRLQITLEQQGWTVVWTASAEDALLLLNEQLPDLVVVDLHLPGISGDEFARRVRMNMRTRSLPMLMLTDSGSMEAQRRGFESGADEYVPKSSSSEMLLLRIRHLLRGTGDAVLAEGGAPAFRRERTLMVADVLAAGEERAVIADRLALHLAQENHDITVVASVPAAVTKLEDESFDCVVMLLPFSVEEGMELCARLDLLRRKQAAPFQIIAVDAGDSTHEMLRVLQAGADDFVDARSGLEILNARIGAHLRRRALQMESARLARAEEERRLELEQARQSARSAEAQAALVDALKLSNAELAATNAKLRDMQAQLTSARDNAERAVRAKTEFLATMSHEIRTPMTGVLGMADLLAAEELTKTQQHYVNTIRSSGSHLLSIINDILDFSRIEAGGLDLECIDFLPGTMLEEVRSMLQPQATERGLALELEIAASPDLAVRGDPTRLRQVLVNLVANGLKFTPKGTVSIAMSELPAAHGRARLRIEVRDTGIGISQESQTLLFHAFVQADRSINRHYGGSGLGLAICKRLVEAMGGTIGVNSERGQGSQFWFELTLPRGNLSSLARQDGAATDSIRPLRVLLADDVPANRELVSAMLTRQGHSVDLVENGAEAVAQANRDRYDLILMDVQMPVMDGMEAASRIRRLKSPMAKVPILALTANVMAAERENYLASGMSGCLIKPIIWGDLFAALAAVASGSDRLDAAPLPQQVRDIADVSVQPLLDQSRVAGMIQKMSPQLVRQMLERGLTGAAESLEQLRAAGADPNAMASEAHRLRGTAGTFGLARISALAGAIEERLGGEPGPGWVQEVAPLIESLSSVLEETRAAVADALERAVLG